MRALRWGVVAVALVGWVLGPGVPRAPERVRDATGPYAFQLLDWETRHIVERLPSILTYLTTPVAATAGDREVIINYFAARVRGASTADGGAAIEIPPKPARSEVEQALERVVAETYVRLGFGRSQAGVGERLFPPVLVSISPPPMVLVLAPRSELRVIESIVLNPQDVATQERLEASADSAGLSSLVAPIGGLATYPSMILDDGQPGRMIEAVAHEWLHHYLIFHPLGAGYWASQETREINETTADLVGQEVADLVLAELGLSQPASETQRRTGGSGPPAFDFRAFMRETRLEVERLLAEGQIDQAESYMNQRRDDLRPHGYNIRKLNQAYFALYGSYGTGFAASPRNPVPDLLRQLRERSGSLADFVLHVRSVRTVADLRALVEG